MSADADLNSCLRIERTARAFADNTYVKADSGFLIVSSTLCFASMYSTVMQALTTVQNNLKTITTTVTAVILQKTNNIAKAIQSAPSPKSSYASVLYSAAT
jgi:hypothetical protein